jgi:hypothetical protein
LYPYSPEKFGHFGIVTPILIKIYSDAVVSLKIPDTSQKLEVTFYISKPEGMTGDNG